MHSTEAVDRSPSYGSITLLPDREPEAASPTDRSEALSGQLQWPWRLGAVPSAAPAPVARAQMKTPPPCIHGFVRAVTRVPGVRCVVAEEGEQDTVHVTTFANPVTEELRGQIYAIEAATITANPHYVFDFHLRRADEATGGTPAGIAGAHYFAVWGDITRDADAR